MKIEHAFISNSMITSKIILPSQTRQFSVKGISHLQSSRGFIDPEWLRKILNKEVNKHKENLFCLRHTCINVVYSKDLNKSKQMSGNTQIITSYRNVLGAIIHGIGTNWWNNGTWNLVIWNHYTEHHSKQGIMNDGIKKSGIIIKNITQNKESWMM